MPNAAHLHLILVHIPIVLFPMATILLGLYCIKGNLTLKNTGCVIMLFACATTITAYLLGEGAEEIVEKIPGILEPAIEEHEESALIALGLACVTAVVAGLTLLAQSWIGWKKLPQLLLILAALTSATLFRVGFEGGKIRHPEAFSAASAVGDNVGEKEDND